MVFPQETTPVAVKPRNHWTVLIVDDEPDVYTATQMALRGVEILGRPLEFLHATSPTQAIELLQARPDVAVILLDVVLESERAGLDLVIRIRNELRLHLPRIILRTGQPGYAPEMQVIRDYDINDYRVKSELTRMRLYTVLTSALRSFHALTAIQSTHHDLEYLLRTQAELLTANTLPTFASRLLEQLAGLYGLPTHAIFCGECHNPCETEEPCKRVFSALGRYADWSRRCLDTLGGAPEVQAIELAFATRRTVHSDVGLAVHLPSRTGVDAVAFLATEELPDTHDPCVLDMFAQHAATATDGIRLVESLRNAAYVDSLTCLPNRSALAETIDTALKTASTLPQRLLLVDIDQFSEINETFGDRIGDALLRAVAQRLRASAGTCVDVARVARVANDTFAAFGSPECLTPLDWTKPLESPFEVDGLLISLTASCGGIDLNDDRHGSGEIINMAYSALKRAKQSGHRSTAFYTPEAATEIKARTHLLHDLRSAFDQRQLFLMYQPQIDASSGRTVGLEALMRWRGENGQLVPPDRFIPIAQQSGLINDLGDWAMRTAIGCAVRLRQDGHSLRMAVNVSVSQILAPGFERMVAQALADAGLPPELLEIEITESVAMQSPEVVQGRLGDLKRMGVSIAIDDFGTGYSSLSVLEKIAIDRLKIDSSFLQGIEVERGGGSLAGMIINLGRTLGLTLIAEGVETAMQRRCLIALGCHELQGYLFSPPMMAAALPDWLARHEPWSPP